MLIFFTVVIMLAVAYARFREGLLSAVTMMINVFLAGLIAFNFFEPLATALESMVGEDSFMAGYVDGLCLFLLFSLALGLLRLITNNLANSEMGLPALAQQLGSVFFGLVTGYLVAGFLLCMVQTLPLGEKFLGFDPQVEKDGSALRRVLPPDRVWLALMHRAGAGPLAQSPPYPFDQDGSFELRYSRLRRIKEQ
jgi:hypothetical protein